MLNETVTGNQKPGVSEIWDHENRNDSTTHAISLYNEE